MILIACVDDKGGMAFNHRRQSQDRLLRSALMDLAGSRPVWMNAYSAGQFEPEYAGRLRVAEDCLDRAGPGELCFVETQATAALESRVEEVVLFRWNRRYPADTWFDLPGFPRNWHLIRQQDFPGHSHDTITQEVYTK